MIPKLALRVQTVGITFLSLRQDLLTKNVLMSSQKRFLFGQQPVEQKPSFLDGHQTINGHGFRFEVL